MSNLSAFLTNHVSNYVVSAISGRDWNVRERERRHIHVWLFGLADTATRLVMCNLKLFSSMIHAYMSVIIFEPSVDVGRPVPRRQGSFHSWRQQKFQIVLSPPPFTYEKSADFVPFVSCLGTPSGLIWGSKRNLSIQTCSGFLGPFTTNEIL